jgi:hypothetical protein
MKNSLKLVSTLLVAQAVLRSAPQTGQEIVAVERNTEGHTQPVGTRERDNESEAKEAPREYIMFGEVQLHFYPVQITEDQVRAAEALLQERSRPIYDILKALLPDQDLNGTRVLINGEVLYIFNPVEDLLNKIPEGALSVHLELRNMPFPIAVSDDVVLVQMTSGKRNQLTIGIMGQDGRITNFNPSCIWNTGPLIGEEVQVVLFPGEVPLPRLFHSAHFSVKKVEITKKASDVTSSDEKGKITAIIRPDDLYAFGMLCEWESDNGLLLDRSWCHDMKI